MGIYIVLRKLTSFEMVVGVSGEDKSSFNGGIIAAGVFFDLMTSSNSRDQSDRNIENTNSKKSSSYQF